MKYFKITKNLSEILGTRKVKDIKGVFMSAEMQMHLEGKTVTYGRIENENLFASNKFISPLDVTIFNNLEEALQDIEDTYVEVLVLEPVTLQLDLQLSGKDKIKDYDPKQSIDSQHNLKKIKDEKMGGIKVANKKARLE